MLHVDADRVTSRHSIVPGTRTVLTGISKLPPATVRVLEADGRSHDRVYWRPDYVRDPAMDTADRKAELTAALRTAVQRRPVADVPGRGPALRQRRCAARTGTARTGTARTGANKLWQPGQLELWLQAHDVG